MSKFDNLPVPAPPLIVLSESLTASELLSALTPWPVPVAGVSCNSPAALRGETSAETEPEVGGEEVVIESADGGGSGVREFVSLCVDPLR